MYILKYQKIHVYVLRSVHVQLFTYLKYVHSFLFIFKRCTFSRPHSMRCDDSGVANNRRRDMFSIFTWPPLLPNCTPSQKKNRLVK